MEDYVVFVHVAQLVDSFPEVLDVLYRFPVDRIGRNLLSVGQNLARANPEYRKLAELDQLFDFRDLAKTGFELEHGFDSRAVYEAVDDAVLLQGRIETFDYRAEFVFNLFFSGRMHFSSFRLLL